MSFPFPVYSEYHSCSFMAHTSFDRRRSYSGKVPFLFSYSVPFLHLGIPPSGTHLFLLLSFTPKFLASFLILLWQGSCYFPSAFLISDFSLFSLFSFLPFFCFAYYLLPYFLYMFIPTPSFPPIAYLLISWILWYNVFIIFIFIYHLLPSFLSSHLPFFPFKSSSLSMTPHILFLTPLTVALDPRGQILMAVAQLPWIN